MIGCPTIGIGEGGVLTAPVLSGSQNTSSATVALDVVGTTDWIHWTTTSPGGTIRKSGGGSLISDYTAGGGAVPTGYTGDARTTTWTGGTPTATGSDNNGVYTGGLGGATGQNFSFTIPAGTAAQTAVFNFGVFSGIGTFVATISDGSSPPVTLISPDTTTNVSIDVNVTILFAAGTPGSTLTLTWTLTTNDGGAGGNVTINAITLA